MKFVDKKDAELDAEFCKKYDIAPLQDKNESNQFKENTFRCLECNTT